MFTPRIGAEIGGYKLERILGRGGFGIVYEAIAEGRRAAVKIMRRPGSGADELRAKRFEREARFIQSLEHPNVIRVFDFGHVDEHVLFYAMELLEGEDLAELLERQGQLPAGAAVEIVLRVLEALVVVHEHGIIHRDIKPANIFLTDGPEQVKVLDFGIATMPEGNEETLTGTGTILGTPRYMAPETALTGSYSHASDIYAVGLVLLEALRGRPAFEGSAGELLRAQVLQDAPIPEDAILHPVGRWLDRALRKSPEDRFTTTREALESLRLAAAAEVSGFEEAWHEETIVESSPSVVVLLSEVDRAALARSVGQDTSDGVDRTEITVVGLMDEEKWTDESLYSDTFKQKPPGESDQPKLAAVIDFLSSVSNASGATPTPPLRVIAGNIERSKGERPTEPLLDVSAELAAGAPGFVEAEQPTEPNRFDLPAIAGDLLDHGKGPDEPRAIASPNAAPGLVPSAPTPTSMPGGGEASTTPAPGEASGKRRTPSTFVWAAGLMLAALLSVGVIPELLQSSDEESTDRSMVRFRVESIPTGASFGIEGKTSGRTPKVVEWTEDDFPLVIDFRHPNGATTTRVVKQYASVIRVELPPPPTRKERDDSSHAVTDEAEEFDEEAIRASVKKSKNLQLDELFGEKRAVNREIVLTRPWRFESRGVPELTTPGSWRGFVNDELTKLARGCMPAERYEQPEDGPPKLLHPLRVVVHLDLTASGRIRGAKTEPFEDFDAPEPEVQECIEKEFRQKRVPRPPTSKLRREKVLLTL